MKLWVDDVKDPRFTAADFGLDDDLDWTWVKTAQDARRILESEPVDVLALDNDLGLKSDMDGRDFAHWILERVLDGHDCPEVMVSITYNPVAEREILATFEDIEKVLDEHGFLEE